MTLPHLIRISRPRFWIYLLGPFLIGSAAGWTSTSSQHVPLLIVLFLLFSFPANLFLYGINDLFDYETDKQNEKKQGYETLVTPTQQTQLRNVVIITTLLLAITILWLPNIARWAIGIFLAAGAGYSAPPIRFKTRPGLDAASNILYAMPGFVSYAVLTSHLPSWNIIIAAGCWCAAMHAFSAVPDIDADRAAHTTTIATTLGARATIYGCAALYLAAGALMIQTHPIIAVCGIVIYVGTMLIAAQTTDKNKIFSIYTRFPIINASFGTLLFFTIAVQTLLR